MILVFGAGGNVGSHVVRALRARGAPVRAFVRDRLPNSAAGADGVEVVRGDLADASTVERALEDVDRVFLVVSNQPEQVALEEAAIDAVARSGTELIVKISALGAEPGSSLPFWDWHGRLERHLHASEVPAVILRPAFYMSGLLGAAGTVRERGVVFAPAGTSRIAMIDPRDVAEVAATVLTDDDHAGRTYELTGPAAITYEHVATVLGAVTGRDVRYVDVPEEAAREAMTADGLPPFLVDALIVLFRLLRGGAQERTTDTVREITGREARDFADFATAHVGSFR